MTILIMKKITTLSLGIFILFSVIPSDSLYAQTIPGDMVPEDYISCVDLTNNLGMYSNDARTGGEVSALQDFLYPEFLKSEPTGQFFSRTRNAVREFQKTHGIPAQGIVGPVTREKIKALSCEKNPVVVNPVSGLNDEYVKARIAPSNLSEAEFVRAITGNAASYYASTSALTSNGVLTGVLRIVETKDLRYPYIGVYHTNLGNGSFQVELTSSKDLKTWTTISIISSDAGMPELVMLPDQSILYAEETTIAGEAPYIRVKYFKSLDALISSPSRPFAQTRLAPITNSWANGTARFGKITYNGDIYNSKIEILHHYFKGPVGNQPQRDQQARGVLTNFSIWTGSEDIALNQAFDRIGYTDNGDRDVIVLGSKIFHVMEGRPSVTAGWDKWKTFLVEKESNAIRIIDTTFPQGGYSAGNPKVSFITLPNGRPGIVATYYVYYGGAPNLSGPQLYVYEL